MKKSIKVLHILYSMNRGGAETMVMNYYRQINKEIVQFDFVISEPNTCHYENEVLELGGRIFRIPIFSKSPLGYIKSLNRFFKIHREYKIVHAHTSAKNFIPLAVAKWNHIPIRICHSHNIRNEKGIIGFLKTFLKPFVKYVATDFMACGEKAGFWLYGKDFFLKNGMMLQNVIDANKYRYNISVREEIRRVNKWVDLLVIGNVARFDSQKNHDFLIDIFNSIYKKNKDVILLLIGDGPLRKQIEEKVISLKLEKSVLFKGVVENVHDYMNAMDVFLLPSLYEGLPLTLIEAQASGLKCFASKDVVSDESNLTGLVEYISLSKTADDWANEILTNINYERKNTYPLIVEKGYDATTSAKYLQELYVNKLNSK